MPENKKPTLLQRLSGAAKSLSEKEAEIDRIRSLAEAQGIDLSQKEPSGQAAEPTPATAAEAAAEAPRAEGATPEDTEAPAAEAAATPDPDPAPAAPSAAAATPAPEASGDLAAQVASLTAEVQTLSDAKAALEGQLTSARSEIDTLKAAAKTAETRAVEILAEAGFNAEEAPAPKDSAAKSTEGLSGRDLFLAAAVEAQPEIFKRN